jgi:KamA family protein
MVSDDIFDAVSKLIADGAGKLEIRQAVAELRRRLNPHPSGQTLNVPALDGADLPGLQHKYRETVLVFPSPGQTCHAYCGYCFRWAQFVGDADFRFATPHPADMTGYLARHPEVTDVLLTGGDPLVMATPVLRRWIEPLLAPELAHVTTIRLGTKALTYWPARVTDGPDADGLLRLVERCVAAGRQVAVMMHVSHGRELATGPARRAVARLRAAGATLRAQAPVIRHVNDDAEVWAGMWRAMVELGIQPYYAFVERDTGARGYFEVPIAHALAVYTEAQRRVSGLARTARGPVMSATPGKIVVDGEATAAGERVFALRMLQARDPALVGRVFFARHSPDAAWIDGLRPAFGEKWPWETSPTTLLGESA